MSYDTTELNLGSGGDKVLKDTLTTVDGAAAPTSAIAQIVKLAYGGPGDANGVSATQPLPIQAASAPFWRVGFAEVGSGLQGLAAAELTLVQTGAGMTVNQSGGNLVITTGTTTNSETVIRSVPKFRGALLARYKAILSQRIANQTFRFELADLIGPGLSYTINSATSVTVTFPSTNPYTSANVGQFLRLSVLSSVGIPGRYAIASVSGLTVTFTVAGWPASGSGTLTLYGHNWLANEYSGTTATSSSFDCQRRGWNSGATTATINTTASPGHVGQINFDVLAAGFGDALVASNTGYQWTNRASRIENIPDEDVDLYFFLVVQNGSTAPASTTTLTVGFLQVEDQPRQKVRVSSVDPTGSHPAPVQVMGGSVVLGGGSASIGTVQLGAAANAVGAVSLFVTTTAGGTSALNYASPATPAGQSVKASAGRLVGAELVNNATAVRWLKVFNATAVTMGTTSALLDIPIPGNGGRLSFNVLTGIAGFGTGIMIAVTAARGLTDNTTTGLALGDVSGMVLFV